jgi:peptidoglycan/LPS O-acetylase OafA/YrhL
VSQTRRPTPSSPLPPTLAERGRVPTLAVLLCIFMLTVTPFLGGLLQGQTANLARNILYACATAVLLGQVWRGSVWAWRITLGLCMAAGLLVFIVGMLAAGVSEESASWQGWVISVAGIAFLLLGTALVATPTIRAFLDARWLSRTSAGRQAAKAGGRR